MKLYCSLLCSASLVTSAVLAADIRIISYNVESDHDTSASEVAKDIREIGPADIWALQEVANQTDMFVLREATEAEGRDMWFELSLAGGGDRLAIVYDRKHFEAEEGPEELTGVGGSRPPLWIRLSEKETGLTLNVVNNHLNRDNANLRRDQAKKLREWAELSDEPTIILGGFNFDLEVPDWIQGSLKGNRAFHNFTRSPSSVTWVEYTPKTKTQCSDRYNSVLDFVFVSGGARSCGASAGLLFTDTEYCDKEATGGANHRPVAVTFTPAAAKQSPEDADLLMQIQSIRQQLDQLESAIRRERFNFFGGCSHRSYKCLRMNTKI